MTETILDRRARLLGPNLPTFYRDPVHLVRGEGVWLWDQTGKRYLDCYNNVPHVGHCHPRVVEAIAEQAARLNTHTRYLHDGLLDYMEDLTSRVGHGIDQGILVCTGSEANDIALRMAQAVTGQIGVIATDATYHGNTSAVSALSAKKPQIASLPDHVAHVPAPRSLDPLGGSCDAQSEAFAGGVAKAIETLKSRGHGVSALILCPFFANEGFPRVPKGFLDPTLKVLRQAGGLVIADEVQPGFGRLGSHFWGHDRLGFAPDIMTMGKPMANGHPVTAVLARAEILGAFREAYGYFNTFGGNPVSAAAAHATLRVIDDEGLMENARDTGAYARKLIAAIGDTRIAQVRGAGLFFGAEFMVDGAPATDLVTRLVEEMKSRGVLLNHIGPDRNTLKIRPPLPFGRAEAELLAETLSDALKVTE